MRKTLTLLLCMTSLGCAVAPVAGCAVAQASKPPTVTATGHFEQETLYVCRLSEDDDMECVSMEAFIKAYEAPATETRL